jgi:hypothetical protein
MSKFFVCSNSEAFPKQSDDVGDPGGIPNDGQVVHVHRYGSNEFVIDNFIVKRRIVGQVGQTESDQGIV